MLGIILLLPSITGLTPRESTVKLSALLDLQLVALQQADSVDVLVELTAPVAAGTTPRPPATLQVVLDRSGSMAGDRLDTAVTALIALVDRLDPTDNLGVVAFDDTVQVVVPAGPLTDKESVRAALRGITPGGGTDLSAGYLRGLQEARRVCGAAGATLLLVSDGHANAGVVDPDTLRGVAAKARGVGVGTTALGLGLGYDEALLDAVAHGGGGSTLFAEEADTASALIAGEVDGLLDQVAQAVSLRVVPGPDVRSVQLLNDLPTSTVGGAVTIELGSFVSGETRKLVLRVLVPGMDTLGLATVATLELVHVALPELVQHSTALDVHVNVVPADLAAGRVPDPVVTQESLLQSAQAAKRQASRLLGRGEVEQAVSTLRTAATRLAGMPGLADEVDTLEAVAADALAGRTDRAAKTAMTTSAMTSRFSGRRPQV